MTSLQEAMASAFNGDNTALPFEDGDDYYTNFVIALKISDGGIHIFGCEDGPCNGYDPYIKPNIFDMSEEKDYYLYVEDMFGQDGWPYELYIDLKRAEN